MPSISAIARVLLCCAALATPLFAQDGRGAVAGLAITEATGAPIPFALVRLRSTSSDSATAPQTLTNAQGNYSFLAVPAGEYKIELLRIGYRPATSPAFRVRAGETVRRDIRGSMVGLPLPVVRVYADRACLDRDALAKDPALSALWDEIQKGVEIRRAFERQYRFDYIFSQESHTRIPGRLEVTRERADTIENEPELAFSREARRVAERAADGYGSGNTLQLPDEEELLDDAFLTEHCVIPVIHDSSSALGIAFRQSTPRKAGFGLRGTIWVDVATRLIRRLQLDYLDGDQPFSEVTIEYADIPAAPGANLRLPRSGTFSLRPSQAPSGTTVIGTLVFDYGAFEEIPRR